MSNQPTNLTYIAHSFLLQRQHRGSLILVNGSASLWQVQTSNQQQQLKQELFNELELVHRLNLCQKQIPLVIHLQFELEFAQSWHGIARVFKQTFILRGGYGPVSGRDDESAP